MSNTGIYWKRLEQLDKQLKKLETWPGSDRNKELILRFKNHLFASGSREVRITKVLFDIRKVCDILAKDLDKVQKQDIERLVATIQTLSKDDGVPYAENTRTGFKRAAKQFYNWFEDEDARLLSNDASIRIETQRMYAYIKKNVKAFHPLKKIDPGSIITVEDVQQVLLNGCCFDYERAFVSVLHETGCRIGEILGLRIKDIQQRDQTWILRVDGKTGERTQPIHSSVPYLSRWLDFHPDKANPEAFCWISENNRYKGQQIRYVGATQILRRCFKRAGIAKPVNPHHFRHSRATLDAPVFSEAIQNKLRGWSQGSKMARRYQHITGKDALDAFQKAHGIKPLEQVVKVHHNQNCACGTINPPESRFCYKCGRALDLSVAIKQQEYLNKAFEIMELIANNPELTDKYRSFLQQSK